MGEPVARRTDPDTSWEAARSVEHLTYRRRAVLFVLRRRGPMTDTDMIRIYNRHPLLPKQSKSGLRTRRCELVHKGLVRDSGQRKTLESGRKSIIWEVAE